MRRRMLNWGGGHKVDAGIPGCIIMKYNLSDSNYKNVRVLGNYDKGSEMDLDAIDKIVINGVKQSTIKSYYDMQPGENEVHIYINFDGYTVEHIPWYTGAYYLNWDMTDIIFDPNEYYPIATLPDMYDHTGEPTASFNNVILNNVYLPQWSNWSNYQYRLYFINSNMSLNNIYWEHDNQYAEFKIDCKHLKMKDCTFNYTGNSLNGFAFGEHIETIEMENVKFLPNHIRNLFPLGYSSACRSITGIDMSNVCYADRCFQSSYLETIGMVGSLDNLTRLNDYKNIFTYAPENVTFYYDKRYDYSKLLDILPSTWTAIPN